MKKLTLLFLSLLLVITVTACDSQDAPQNSDSEPGKNGEIAVFYYTYSDTYISAVRAALDKEFQDSGIK